MGKRRRENDIDEAPRSKRGSQADEEDDVFQITQGQSQEKDEPMDNFQDDLEESGENVWTLTAGTIVYVKMKNFMCHAEFVYKPINRINFISGANGSGKSAVLAALQFALGGNARLANRGTTNKNFIRTNQPNASVEVALFNQGENEYKREIYGKRLIIHRTVNTSGVTCLKFKDENGKVVIDKVNKDDLDRVLINFNIQIDNPIALLNQDTAKTFLFKCQPDKLYEFFMKATQLDECTRIYEDALKGIEDSKKSLQLKFGQLKKLKEESEKWEKKYENLKNLDKKNEDISDLKHELASAMLIEQSAIYQNVVNELEKLDKQILVHQNCIDKEEADKKELHDQKNMILSDIQALNEEIEKHQDNLSEMREDVRKMKTSKIDLERDANDRSQKKVHIEGQLKQVVVAIKKIRQTDGDAIARATKEREDKIQDMKSNKDALEARISTTRNHITNLEHTIESTRSEFKAQESKIKATKAEQAQINRQIKAIKSSGKNSIALFGQKMPQLCSAIKGTNFKKEPIGPLGVEIKIKNDVSEIEKKLIECELSGMLSSFIVDNFEDRRSLDRLAKDIGCSINIITSKFVKTRHDISAGKCQSNVYSSIIDLLEISNDNVYNCLIDQKNVERVILIKRDAEARNVLSNQNTVPRNCKYALTGNFYQYYPVPLYRSYGMKNAGRQGPSKLGTDNNEILAGMIKEIEKNDKEIKIMTDELDKIHSTLSESEKELNKNNKTCQDCNSQIQKLDQEIFRLKQKNQSQKAPDMSALEEDKEKYEEQLEEIVQEVSQAKQKIESWAELMKEKLSEFKKAEKEVDQLNSKLEPMEKDQLLKIENQLIKRQTDRVRAEKKLEKINLKKVEINKTEAEVKERVEKLEERLRNDFKGEKIETDRPCHAIQKMIKAAEEALRVQRNTLEPSQVIKKNRVESYTKYTEANQNFEWLKDLLVKMIAMEKDREKGFFQVRGSMCRSVMLSFANHLQRRNFQGKLKFKHKAVPPTLDLAVDPIGGDPKKTNKRDMKTLSGGEKSFSTVSLVLAFWDVIPTPFRILDEFDVFMDMVNRRTALNMMIDYIKEKKNKQYVFLTPLNMNSVDASSEDLQIQYLKKTDGS